MPETRVYYRALDAGIFHQEFDSVSDLLKAALETAVSRGPYITRQYATVERVTETFSQPVITREFI
jgi:hypothetical protein